MLMLYTLWYRDMYLPQVRAYASANSDTTTFMRYADHGLGGTVVIPPMAGC